MLLTNWLRSLAGVYGPLSRHQRRVLASRRRRAGRIPVTGAEKLELRTLLAAPNPLDLGSLTGTNGFRLDGTAAGDNSGRAVSSAGDVNGDGFEDLLIGARGASPNGGGSGSTYVVFGRSGGFTSSVDLSALDGTDGFRLDGAVADDRSGHAVSGAGDVNGDGFGDLIVGAYLADPNGDTSAGSSYVVFGHSGAFASVIDLSGLDGTTGFRLDGEMPGDQFGFSVSDAGDVNGDGLGDVIIGARLADVNASGSGSSYVLFGRSNGFTSGGRPVVSGRRDRFPTSTAADSNEQSRRGRSAARGTSTAMDSTI